MLHALLVLLVIVLSLLVAAVALYLIGSHWVDMRDRREAYDDAAAFAEWVKRHDESEDPPQPHGTTRLP